MNVAGRAVTLLTGAATAAAALVATGQPALAAIPTKPARTWATNGQVTAILPVGNRVYVGGTFSAVVDPAGLSHPVGNLAAFDATTGAFALGWTASTNGTVNALALSADGSRLFVGGAFSKVDGANRTKLAAVSTSSGAVDAGWTPAIDSPVDALAVGGSSVYVSGGFSTVTDGSGAHARAFVAKLASTDGTLDTSWQPTPNDRVRAVLASGGSIFIGGDFSSVSGGHGTSRVAKLDATTGALDPAYTSQPNNLTNTNGWTTAPVFDLATDGTRLFEAVGGSGGACAAFDAGSGVRAWSKHSNGNMQAVRVANGTLFCGGHFSGVGSFDGQTRYKLAAVTVSTGTTTGFAPTVNSALGTWSLGVDATRLYLGGDFTKVSGVDQTHFAEFVDTAAQTTPLAPTLVGQPADQVVHLSWQPPSSDGGTAVTKYKVYRRLPGGSYGNVLATVTSGTTYDDTAVTNGTTYVYKVTAWNALGEGSPSNEVSVTPHKVVLTTPGPPTGLAAVGDAGVVHLTWAAPNDDGGSPVSSYRVYRGTSPGGEAASPLAEVTTPSYDDAAIVADTTYYYFVTAVNAQGEGTASVEVSATPTAGRPSAPTLSGTVNASGQPQLSWTAPASNGGSPVTKYVVIRDTIQLAHLTAPAFSYTDTTASPGDHTYQVKAVNAVGGGQLSNKVVLTAR